MSVIVTVMWQVEGSTEILVDEDTSEQEIDNLARTAAREEAWDGSGELTNVDWEKH